MASPPPRFFMYSGAAFPPPEALLACPALRRMAPLAEPMAQFYSELGVHRLLRSHPARMADPAAAELFYVPWCPHLDQDAGRCNKTNHRGRAEGVAAALRASPWWRRHNGSDHVYVCACVMMRSMLSSLWTELGRAIHLRHHAAPRNKATPSACTVEIPYFNADFASSAAAAAFRAPGRARPILAHFRGRVMNGERSALVKRYGGRARHLIRAEHGATAARCNLNKCSAKALAAHNFSATRHFDEMTRSTFCLVPVGDSPPSSRLYLAIVAGCVPVFLSDEFRGFAPHVVPWASFTLRFAQAQLKSRAFDLTAELEAVAADGARLGALQAALRAHAPDVLYEEAGAAERLGSHILAVAGLARRRVCQAGGGGAEAPPLAADTIRTYGIAYDERRGFDEVPAAYRA